jgi:hypothetical protein
MSRLVLPIRLKIPALCNSLQRRWRKSQNTQWSQYFSVRGGGDDVHAGHLNTSLAAQLRISQPQGAASHDKLQEVRKPRNK